MMYTRLIYLMFFALVLALVGNVQAAQVTWNDGTGDHLWSTAGNWDPSLPTSADWIKVRNGLPGATIASEGAEADKVSVGYDLDSTLTVDGGSLTTVQYLQMGRSDGSGMLNMISGAINVGEDLEVGYGGPGIVNMTGGAIIVGREFTIPQTSTYTAEVNLDGGTIIVDGVLIMSALGSMNITAGTLIIDGDALTYVQGYIDDGLIIGYGGAGAAHVDYDATDDKTTVYAVHALDPQPANGATASAATDTLGWMLPDPNSPASIVTCDVILGTDPNMANLSVNTLVVDGQAVETADIAVVEDEDYYWQITVYDSAFAEPVLVSPIFTFNTRNVAPTADAGDDLETWLADGSRDVILAGIAIDDDGPGPYSYEWEVTSNANDLNPATLDDATLPNATVTLPEAGEYTLALIVNDGADPSAADSIQITVYADSCEHARNQAGFAAFPGDTDGDCDVDMVDLANLSANWLQENYSIE